MLSEIPLNFRATPQEFDILSALVLEAEQQDGHVTRSDIIRRLIHAEGRRLKARQARKAKLSQGGKSQ